MKLIKYRWLYFLISGVCLLASIFSLIKWQIKPSVDFRGGNLWEISFDKEISRQDWLSFIKSQEGVLETQQTGSGSWLIKSHHAGIEKKQVLGTKVKEKFGSFRELKFESLEPSIGKDLLVKTLMSILLAIVGILLYVSFRFQDKSFGICAVLAMLHDSFVLLGSASLLGHFLGFEVDGLFVTAVLTILSFSVHDTVVIYDSIRELIRFNPKMPFEDIADLAITKTLVRSINNSMTIIFVLVALFLLGGETTRWFSLTLLIGTVSGTYSSTFIAVPLLVVLSGKSREAGN